MTLVHTNTLLQNNGNWSKSAEKPSALTSKRATITISTKRKNSSKNKAWLLLKFMVASHSKVKSFRKGQKTKRYKCFVHLCLTSEKVTISNIPDIVDVNKLIALVANNGRQGRKSRERARIFFRPKKLTLQLPRNRRFQKTCVIFARLYHDCWSACWLAMVVDSFQSQVETKSAVSRLDTHFEGFALLGAKFNYDAGEHFLFCRGRSISKALSST